MLGLLALALGAGCGYRQDVPRLPGGARTIALQAIANHTTTGELDVRLRAQLEHRLAQQAHLRVTAPAQATLLLSVRLDTLTVSRVLDPAIASQRSLTHTLTGHVTLLDRHSGRKFLADEAVSVSVQRLHDPGVVETETPAIRDEALDDTLAAFAAQVERRLFRTF